MAGPCANRYPDHDHGQRRTGRQTQPGAYPAMTDQPALTALPTEFHQRKAAEIQAKLPSLGLDGLLLLDAFNVRYASGFVHIPSERPLGLYLPAGGDPALFVPLLEQEHAAETWIKDIRVYFEYPGEQDAVVWMARESGAGQLGIDAISYDGYCKIAATGISLTATPLVEWLRWIKSPEE